MEWLNSVLLCILCLVTEPGYLQQEVMAWVVLLVHHTTFVSQQRIHVTVTYSHTQSFTHLHHYNIGLALSSTSPL
jgi:hypothetical protein